MVCSAELGHATPSSATCASCATTTRPGSSSPAAAARSDPSTPELAAGRRRRARARHGGRRARPARLRRASIVFDNEAAAHDITAYVRSLGHERIAFVEGPPGLHTSAQRLEGFTARGRDRPRPRRLRLRGRRRARPSSCWRATALPDAIVAANDEAAIGVLMRLRDAGVDVPGQVSIAGIDDTRPARFVGLTTVSVPLHEMGRRGRARRARRRQRASDVVLPHRLAPRATTAPR